MKMTLIIISSIILLCIILYYVLVPKDSFITLSLNGKPGITFSRSSIEFEKSPDIYPTNGFDHLSSYIKKLMVFSKEMKSIIISTKDGEKALGLDSREERISVGFTTEWKKNPQEEQRIRAYFDKLNITPHEDYLAGNGGVVDSTRILQYYIDGSEKEITELTKDILVKLSAITENEELHIHYHEF